MVFLFYQLALNKDKAEKLYQELEGVELTDIEALRSLPYLNAVIKETLRYHPAVPSGGYRDTSSEGMMIGDTFIPPNTTIVAPRYILNRCKSIAPPFFFTYLHPIVESCYARPNEWLPERWDTQPEFVRNSKSFLPFAQGKSPSLSHIMDLGLISGGSMCRSIPMSRTRHCHSRDACRHGLHRRQVSR